MSVYYKGKLISGIREILHLTLSEYNALSVKPDMWVRTDSPDSDRGIDADDVLYGGGLSVKDKIDSMLTVESDDYSSQVLSGCTIRVRKINRVITVCIYTQTTTTSGSEVEIFTLPQKYWPSTTFNFPLTGTSNNYCRISIDGKIVLASNNSYAGGSVCMI